MSSPLCAGTKVFRKGELICLCMAYFSAGRSVVRETLFGFVVGVGRAEEEMRFR